MDRCTGLGDKVKGSVLVSRDVMDRPLGILIIAERGRRRVRGRRGFLFFRVLWRLALFALFLFTFFTFLQLVIYFVRYDPNVFGKSGNRLKLGAV